MLQSITQCDIGLIWYRIKSDSGLKGRAKIIVIQGRLWKVFSKKSILE